MKEHELKITDMRKVEVGKLFDEVFYRIFEIHDENEKLARSMRETLSNINWGRLLEDMRLELRVS